MIESTTQQGLYLAAFFSDETTQRIEEYLIGNKIPNSVARSSLHTTIVYSRAPVEMEPIHTIDVLIPASNCHLEIWDTPSGRTLVLKFFSPYFLIRFNEAMALGASYDYDEYKPHISLSYDVGPDFTIDHLPTIDFDINVVGEYSEVLDSTDD
jgi:hypothetical protein